MRAMILAAGLGSRMRSLTHTTPKPLLLVKGQPLIVHTIRALASNGINEIVINVHHHAQRIMDYLADGAEYGVKLVYSLEQKLLDTGGGIKRALPLLGSQPFLVVSADIYTDFPFARLKERSIKLALEVPAELAYLVMVDNPAFHQAGDFALINGRLAMSGEHKLTYANIGVFHPALFEPAMFGAATSAFASEITPTAASVDSAADADQKVAVVPEIFPLNILLRAAIRRGEAAGEHYTGTWYNIGTPELLAEVNASDFAMRT